MISFCKSSFHSLIGFTDSDDRRHRPHRWRNDLPPPDRGGLHLVADDFPKPPHVVESPAVGPAAGGGKPADPGSWGLHDAVATCGGLGLCTESLGSESCDSGIEIDGGDELSTRIVKRNTRQPSRRRRAEVRYPPPLPWMMGSEGRRRRFMKAERRDGRFVLTEIRIDPQPEMLRAIRNDGRLRLELVGTVAEGEVEAIDCLEGEVESPEAVEISGEEGSEENAERWELPRVRKEAQRCVEAVSSDSGAPLWWSHRFVTTA